MKKILVLLSLLAFVLTATGCENTGRPNGNEAKPPEPLQSYTAETPDADTPAISDVLQVTPEMLIGTWILESQETPEAVMDRAVILESGVKLLYGSHGTGSPFFWYLYNNVLTSHLAGRTIPMAISIDDNGALIFTYDDGLTATYILSDCALPERVIIPELVGTWHLADQTGDAILPDTVKFSPDGSGIVFYNTEHLRNFEWGVIEDAVLLKDFEDTHGVESSFIIDVAFIEEMDGYAFSIIFDNGIRALYFNEDMIIAHLNESAV